MDEGSARRRAGDRRTARGAGGGFARPDRVALWAFLLAVGAMIAAAATAQAGSGGLSSGGGIGPGSGTVNDSRYSRMWDGFSRNDRHWAHRTSECESGGDPQAIGGGGAYRGAFQFTRPSWRDAPKSPGGDPIRYTWRTQAVVAVVLKHHMGTRPWPVCG